MLSTARHADRPNPAFARNRPLPIPSSAPARSTCMYTVRPGGRCCFVRKRNVNFGVSNPLIGEAMRAQKARRWLALTSAAVLAAAMASLASAQPAVAAPAPAKMHLDCSKGTSLCTEVADSEEVFGEGNYVGHDEPAVTFYDNHAGAGNNATYLLRIPKDPPTLPKQDGTGGTFNFQLHPAFWFGMAMCDSESAPNFTKTCVPNTDANIFDDSSTSSPKYIGKHPGTAFMEMQFYPPGWVKWPEGNSCDALGWCAALNIDSLSLNLNATTSATFFNNADCLNRAGVEPVNFAFVTKNGVA